MAGTTGLGVQSLTLRCRDWGCAPRCRVAPWVCYPTPQSVYVAALLFLCHLIGMPQNRDDNDATLFWHVRAALEICSAALLVDNGDLIGLPVGFPQRSCKDAAGIDVEAVSICNAPRGAGRMPTNGICREGCIL